VETANDMSQMMTMMSRQTEVVMRSWNCLTITKYRSTAMASTVSVDTYTPTPSAIGTAWHRASPNGQVRSSPDSGVNGLEARFGQNSRELHSVTCYPTQMNATRPNPNPDSGVNCLEARSRQSS